MKKLLWVYFERNWAYDFNVKILSAALPQYEHYIFITSERNRNDLDLVVSKMDIIVSMNPMNFYLHDELTNVFAILDSVRAVAKSKEDAFGKMAGIITTNNVLFEFAKARNKHVILQPNGLDLEIFKPLVDKHPNRIFTVGFAGNIDDANKGDYKGWLPYQESVNSLSGKIEQLNAIYGSNQIPFDKMVSEFYQKIDCLVLLSKNEGCSNVIAEALACGVPVICTKVGYHGHALRNQKQCIFVDRTPASIKDAILQIYVNPLLHGLMKEAAREFACQYHDIKKVSKNYADFFESNL